MRVSAKFENTLVIFSSSACLGEGPLRQQFEDLGLQEGVGERDGVAQEEARLELGPGVPFSVASCSERPGGRVGDRCGSPHRS